MGLSREAIFEAALALPDDERALLPERLLETLSPEQPDSDEEELVAELERRRADVERGTAGALPWSELKHQE